MTFVDIPGGSSVFLDANVFVYEFGPDPQYGAACKDLLHRVQAGHVKGYASAQEVSDVAHRLMTFEACQTLGWPYQGIARRLRSRHTEISRLHRFQKAIENIPLIGVVVVPVAVDDVIQATNVSIQHGLLSNDALIVTLMRKHGITAIASADSDLDRVPGIVRFSPA